MPKTRFSHVSLKIVSFLVSIETLSSQYDTSNSNYRRLAKAFSGD
ncbi:hypothetical protein V144x_44060 [Gimesia aquarii]|uniref:Uncharacterized protein n=1 Tax=Gimesia aquarii TaxID=2527964 RepID=A0A517W0X7_9PLAN|nr:hypothetical protein V144x_44060 [Gimesia aquarii]